MESHDPLKSDAVFRTIDAKVDIGNDDLALVARSIADHDELPADARNILLTKGHSPDFISRVEAIGVRALRAEAQRFAVLVRARQVGAQQVADELALDDVALQLLRESQAIRRSEVLEAILSDVG